MLTKLRMDHALTDEFPGLEAGMFNGLDAIQELDLGQSAGITEIPTSVFASIGDTLQVILED